TGVGSAARHRRGDRRASGRGALRRRRRRTRLRAHRLGGAETHGRAAGCLARAAAVGGGARRGDAMMAAALKRRPVTLGDLLGPEAGEHAATQVKDLVLDSRQVTPGAAFVAVAGAREHGARHAAEALGRGASVVLYEPAADIEAPPRPSVAVPRL